MTGKQPLALRCSLLAGISLFASAAVTTPAFAESDSTASPALTTEIIVTAQRKEEKLSKVPVSVVAFGAEALKTRNITSEQDIGTLVPGLQVKNGQNSNQLSFSMRGQTLDPFSGTSPAVLTYLNEAPYNPGNTATQFFDLGSVQVLKGPQGTLFGRNATGGAVLYSTPMPGDQFDGFLIARVAQRDFDQVQGAIDLPIAPGLFVARIAFDATRGNGYITNVNTGNTLGDKDSQSVRGTFVFTPGSSVKNVTVVQYSHVKGSEGEGNLWDYNSAPTAEGGAASQYTSNGITHSPNTSGGYLTDTLAAIYGNNNGPAAPGFFPGAVEGYAAWSRANPYKIWLQYDLPHYATNTFVSNTTTVDLGSDTKLKNLFSYMQGYAVTPGNLAGGPFGALWLFNEPNNATGLSGTPPGGEVFHSTTFSDEVQIQGKLSGGQLEYTAGAFYSSQIRHEIIPITIGNDLGLPAPIADIDYAYRNTEISKAIYAQGTYKFTDQLSATLGGRYTWESLGISQENGSLFNLLAGGSVPAEHKNLSAPAWTFNVQYQVDPHNMVYFSQRGSFRSGNFNGTVAPSANSFGNEYVHDFELGYKFNGRIADAPVQFNIAAYDVIVKHAQHALYAIVGGQPAGFTVNVPESVTKGIEVDGAVGLTSWLDLNFNFAYTDAKYTDGLVPIPGGSPVTVDTYPDSPKVSASVGADFKFPVPESLGKVDLRADYYGQTHTFFSSTNGTVTPGTELSGYSTVGLRLNWKEIKGSRVSAAVYVRNVANKLYYISGYALGNSSGLNTAYPGEPRTIGGELSVKF
ncbi:TonB-dependent receptor [Novosphingobium sp. Fuku2-ISO-50]|uniref:TonB-dependent receptor n=1 Tax=Novosphingobium sp. Fuku2-ISO-50 TaxID=1739114 RepID=UPI00076C3AFA|nr:TonB-dependent receptor [Novosphingobium sp. Fuku2-ISO-50]KUR76645.1 TonB-dependent receptor [Novosphingobium sp. Fuku2-ISO-50]